MKRHPFDPLAAALGLAIVALAVAVAMFELGGIEDNLVGVIAGAAVFVALLIIPWRRNPSATRVGEVVEQ